MNGFCEVPLGTLTYSYSFTRIGWNLSGHLQAGCNSPGLNSWA
jgi:hypothetical protein